MELQDTWLIQRLRAKPKDEFLAKVSQVFGGGGLGLSQEAWKLCQQFFDFEYMGAAEFEWGAIPKSLNELAQKKKELTGAIITLTKFKNEKRSYTKNLKDPPKTATVYVLAPKDILDDVIKRIEELAQNKINLKELSHFARALDPIDEYDLRTKGWLELNNHFMFFTDKEMYRAVLKLFTGQEDPPEVDLSTKPKKTEK